MPIKSSFTLSPGWHILAALVMSIALASPLISMTLAHGAGLRHAGHLIPARYNEGMGIAFFLIALAILLPRSGNASRITLFRLLGRRSLIIRYFLAAAVAVVLLGLGVLIEKISA